jgi:hypothetical protein
MSPVQAATNPSPGGRSSERLDKLTGLQWQSLLYVPTRLQAQYSKDKKAAPWILELVMP